MKKILNKQEYYVGEEGGISPGVYTRYTFEEGHTWVDSQGRKTCLEKLFLQKKEGNLVEYEQAVAAHKKLKSRYSHLSLRVFNAIPAVKEVTNKLKELTD